MDPTRRKLRIPNWYSPYLEKFRIYELFHELARELIIQEPEDHVLFLKEILCNAAVSRYAPRIIIFAPPEVNTVDIAHFLCVKTKASVVLERDFVSTMGDTKLHKNKTGVKVTTQCLLEVLRSNNTYYTGWILPDYPKNVQEAKAMLQAGILPTHVFQLIPPYSPDLSELRPRKHTTVWQLYRRKIVLMREMFKHQLVEVKCDTKNCKHLTRKLLDLINIRNRHKGPIIPRICILGPRGSGRKTQAKKLADAFKLIHVDFEYLLCQHWISETHLGHLLRQQKDEVGQHSLLLTAVVHKRILEHDCLDKGWVLTGFPNTVDDLKNLDMIDTPPNRIIFLECDLDQCRARIINRRVNIYSGSVLTLINSIACMDDPILKIHPKDREETFEAELNYYCENYDQMRKYCGRTAYLINGNEIVQWVAENIAAIVMRPLPEGEPRQQEYEMGSTLSNYSSVFECNCTPANTASLNIIDKDII